MKTIAEQLNIKEFPFIIKDKNGKVLYAEYSDNSWYKYEYDENGNVRHYEDSSGYWYKSERDENGYERYYEDSSGYWYKRERDENGYERYYENSYGEIRDNRVKEMTISEAEKQFKIKIV
jgi:hypothetical protein